jgi:uncharacterized protein YbjT (DUF2867 family)
MILVVGSTGLLGGEICRRLTLRKQPLRALVRSTSAPAKLDALRRAGAELAVGDLKDPASLQAAAQGATAIISTASSTLSRQAGDSIESVDHQGQLNLIEAAKANGIERVLFVSFRDDPEAGSPLAGAKRIVEQALRALDYTIIQASWFMEVWLSPALGFDYQNARARIYGSGHAPISWISYHDVAELCVRAINSSAARRRVIEAGGPEPLSPLDVVRIFEAETGRGFAVEHVPEDALRAQMAADADPLQRSFAALMLQYARGDVIDMAPVLRDFPIPLTSVVDYAKKCSAGRTLL